MCAAVLEISAHAEARFRLDGAREPVLLLLQVAHRDVQHRHLHAAGDVHADGVRNHRILRGQHAADGQAVTDVCVRHERARDRHRQQTRLLHLHHRVVFEMFAPLPIFHRLGARLAGGAYVEQCLGKLTAQWVIDECRRIGHNGRDLLVQPRFVAAAEDELGHKIRRPAGGFTQRHAESEKIFGVHKSTVKADFTFGRLNAKSNLESGAFCSITARTHNLKTGFDGGLCLSLVMRHQA